MESEWHYPYKLDNNRTEVTEDISFLKFCPVYSSLLLDHYFLFSSAFHFHWTVPWRMLLSCTSGLMSWSYQLSFLLMKLKDLYACLPTFLGIWAPVYLLLLLLPRLSNSVLSSLLWTDHFLARLLRAIWFRSQYLSPFCLWDSHLCNVCNLHLQHILTDHWESHSLFTLSLPPPASRL